LKLHEFPILTDENIHREVVAYLRQRGCDVVDVQESGLIGSEDSAILQAALSQNRIVVTHDADFGALAIAALEPIVGVVFLRPGHIDPKFTIGTLQALFERDVDLTPPFIIVARRTRQEVSIRIRLL
jgi:predicted nuclease of predicted toxin-antitoxin system